MLDMDISKWIAAARAHNKGRGKLTQQQLADELSVSKQNVSAWEKGHHQPSWAQIVRIAEVTGHPLLNEERLRFRWPFSEELLTRLVTVEPEKLMVLENQVRVAIEMPLLPVADHASGKQIRQAA